jgi:hypothetical protein
MRRTKWHMQRKNDRRQQKNQKKMQMIQQRSKFQLMNNRLYKLLKKKSCTRCQGFEYKAIKTMIAC